MYLLLKYLKLKIGKNLKNFLRLIMSKLKNKWLENGEIIVVLLLVEVLKKLVLLLKKTYGYQERDELVRLVGH